MAVGNVIQNPPLTEMAMGYARSRALAAAARLKVADAIGDGERDVAELAKECGADQGALHRLLRALGSFGVVVEKAPGRFALTELGRPLRKDVPGSEWAAIVFWADLLAESWAYLTECIRTGDSAMKIMEGKGIKTVFMTDPEAGGIFRAVMGTGPTENYMPIVRAWDFSKARCVADLGGGGGALLLAVLEAHPNVSGMLVDQSKEAVEGAAPRFAGLTDRCKLITADLREEVPAGADVYMMKHVLHGSGDEVATKMLTNVRAVLPEGGRLLIIELTPPPDCVDREDLNLERRLMSDLNMLAVTGGSERSAAAWRKLLEGAMFECLGITAVPGELVSIIEAVPA